jgi:hypothetical protein
VTAEGRENARRTFERKKRPRIKRRMAQFRFARGKMFRVRTKARAAGLATMGRRPGELD